MDDEEYEEFLEVIEKLDSDKEEIQDEFVINGKYKKRNKNYPYKILFQSIKNGDVEYIRICNGNPTNEFLTEEEEKLSTDMCMKREEFLYLLIQKRIVKIWDKHIKKYLMDKYIKT